MEEYKEQEYLTAANELIQTWYDGGQYHVSNEFENEIRWFLSFNSAEKALAEFERWRK